MGREDIRREVTVPGTVGPTGASGAPCNQVESDPGPGGQWPCCEPAEGTPSAPQGWGVATTPGSGDSSDAVPVPSSTCLYFPMSPPPLASACGSAVGPGRFCATQPLLLSHLSYFLSRIHFLSAFPVTPTSSQGFQPLFTPALRPACGAPRPSVAYQPVVRSLCGSIQGCPEVTNGFYSGQAGLTPANTHTGWS